MSKANAATRALTSVSRMRIIALPLTSRASTSVGTGTYYHFQTPPPAKSGKPSLLKRATGKTAELWANFGKAPEGSWKQRTFQYGERIMDRIEFEELALKSMDPSLGPSISNFGKPGSDVETQEKERISIPLVYPSFFGAKVPPVQHLRTLLEKRTPSHRKGFYFWMLISPLTAPFMLIPIIPNLPFFFCAWRSWHHYRAYRASQYLESLIDSGAVEPEPNIGLDQIYEKYKPPPPSSPSESPSSPETPSSPSHPSATQTPSGFPKGASSESSSGGQDDRVILSRDAVPKITSYFELPPSAEADLLRALDQVAHRLQKGVP